MIKKELTVLNKMGLHARPAGIIVSNAVNFKSDLKLINDDAVADCKSILSLITLSAVCGTNMTLHASGDDEHEAALAIEQLFISKFDEE